MDPIINLSIELLPEFGFNTHNEPVFGPGSVFQGIVHLRMKESPIAADRLVLTFRGAEHATAIHDGIKFLVPLIKNPFFGMQQTLWQRTRDDCLLSEPHYQFPFTIQMPMTQFPPSMEHALYQCRFDLSAKLIRTTFTLPTVMTQRTIQYMPFIETSLLKQPVIEEGHGHGLDVSVRLCSLAYVPGDTIPITVVTSCRPKKQTKDQPAEVNSILLELCETVRLVPNKAISVTRTVASHLHKPYKYAIVQTPLGKGAEYHVCLKLPVELTPSVNYSKVVQLSYTLRIHIKSSRGVFLSPLFHATVDMELALKIGTLGYGIRASQDLKMYDNMKNHYHCMNQANYHLID
ncbi:uncharacterized protein B0P05DRAFT_575178 [Gilbertella persicaria]|uniref:uncharacterized protein n=1 Tax=Gilbertella persicaria TaxID=101096 RepID=UPI00221F5D97|nr:uncharacterized protein B0P05DRAFT_575178 [Gilbertella persicaria]KAI8057592.1 hypothetical protein B0P05DRAFT_575178 [Gilbertella persicaria]